jgi:small-conductance mechanosensitive channel
MRVDAMRRPVPLLLIAALLSLAACGVETATTAATGAAIKKQEVDAGKKTLDQAQQKIDQAAQQMQKRAEQDAAAADK